MDIDLAALRAECETILTRLDRSPKVPEVHGIHMALAPLIGEIQGAVGACRREGGSIEAVEEAEAALQRLKASARRVGADIRLASPGALTLGLQTALGEALQAIDAVEQSRR